MVLFIQTICRNCTKFKDMLNSLREILDSDIPDSEKVQALKDLVECCYTQDEYKRELLAAMGPPQSFLTVLKSMSSIELMTLINESGLDSSEYGDLDQGDNEETLIDFIIRHKDYLNFDFGHHFTTRSDIGTAIYAMNKKLPDGKIVEGRPSAIFNVGANMIQAFNEFEVVYVAGNRFEARQIVMAWIDGALMRCKLVRQPNPFQWAVEFQDNGKRCVEFVEIRNISPIVNP